MKIYQIFAIAAALSLAGCGSTKDATTDDQQSASANPAADNAEQAPVAASSAGSTTTSQNQMTEANSTQQKQAVVKYRLIISFISIGEGTDPVAREKMEGILSKWEMKAGKKIQMESFPWGREGEVDFCFLLNELSAPDQAALARELREAFIMHPLVQISEYQESMHKR